MRLSSPFPVCVCVCLCICGVVQVSSGRSCWEQWACPLSLITPTTARHCSCLPCTPAPGHSRVPHTAPYPSGQGFPCASDPSSCSCSFWSTRGSPCCPCTSSNPTAPALWAFSKVGYDHLLSVLTDCSTVYSFFFFRRLWGCHKCRDTVRSNLVYYFCFVVILRTLDDFATHMPSLRGQYSSHHEAAFKCSSSI